MSHQDAGKVEMTSLSTYLRRRDITEIDFLKVDTEGFDLDAVISFPGRFTSLGHRVQVENNKTVALGYRFEELAGFLNEKASKCM